MKIALLGYGKMGKVIETIAIERGHSIALKTTKNISNYRMQGIDMAIDFSVPNAAVTNITTCLNNNIPVVSGTTGWLDHYNDVIDLCHKKQGAFIYASNFSIGVNIFFELNKKLAEITNTLQQYNVTIEEIHHTQKLDAPSGTAITLAKDIIENSKYNDWKLETEKPERNTIAINAKRITNIPGTHTVNYESDVDHIAITHKAHNRNGFALGAIIAAEWLHGKTGVYTMHDVLNIT